MQYNKIWVNDIIYHHKWVNMAKKGFGQHYLIDTFVGIYA